MTIVILQGDVRRRLAELPSDSFDCIVTSPPYWGLRDYGVACQIGLEPTLTEYLDTMVSVCRELRRVLKPSGTFWLNVGDSYATAPNGKSASYKADGSDDRTFRDKPFSTVGPIRAGASGNKGNVGSDGVRRNEAGPIGGKRVTAGVDRQDVDVGGWGASDTSLRWRGGGFLKPKDLCMVPNRLAIRLQEDGWYVRSEIIWHKPNPMPESVTDRPTSSHEKIWLLTKSERYAYDADAVREPYNEASVGRYAYALQGTAPTSNQMGGDTGRREREKAIRPPNPLGRNLRNVWSITTESFKEAHFATFPPELAERCVKAGCPVGGHVLDPFGGAGTTGLVADRLGRDATLIEINPSYVEIARERLRADAGMFTEIECV